MEIVNVESSVQAILSRIPCAELCRRPVSSSDGRSVERVLKST